jgi:hypothetical protein
MGDVTLGFESSQKSVIGDPGLGLSDKINTVILPGIDSSTQMMIRVLLVILYKMNFLPHHLKWVSLKVGY